MKGKGFTLVELIIAIGLAAIFIPAIIYVFSFSFSSASQGEKYTQAYTIAQEQMEAVYFLKSSSDVNWDWVNSPADTILGIEYYQPKKSGLGWTLGPKTTTPVEDSNGFTAKVEILPGETSDLNSRTVVVKVAWKENGAPSDVSLVSYVTKH